MNAGVRVGEFLRNKLQENKLRRTQVARDSGLSGYTVNNIYNDNQNNVSLKTVITLANYFNCSLDEVFGRDTFTDPYHKTYNKITSIEAMNKIKNFIRIKFEESDKNLPRFSKNCGLKKTSITGFLNDNEKHRALNSNNILAIADHFNISLDVLIGRSENPSKIDSRNKDPVAKITEEPLKLMDISQKLSAKNAAILNEIQQEIKEFHNEIKQKINTLNGVKTKVKDNSQSR